MVGIRAPTVYIICILFSSYKSKPVLFYWYLFLFHELLPFLFYLLNFVYWTLSILYYFSVFYITMCYLQSKEFYLLSRHLNRNQIKPNRWIIIEAKIAITIGVLIDYSPSQNYSNHRKKFHDKNFSQTR